MVRSFVRTAIAVGFLLASSAPPSSGQQLVFRVITEADGAPASAFGDAVQDSAGRLWLSSRAGVAVFDGYEWRREDVDPASNRLATGRLVRDEAGTLWTAAQATPARVFRRTPAGWQSLPPPDHLVQNWASDLTALAARSVGADTRVAVSDGDPRILLWDGADWRRIDLPEQARVYRLTWQGERLLACTSTGLHVLEGPAAAMTVRPSELDLPRGPVYAFVPGAAAGAAMVAGRGWVGRVRQETFTELVRDDRCVLNSPYAGVSASLDSLGGLWLGDYGLVLHWHPLTGLETVTPHNGLPSAGAGGIIADREGQVWIMNARGISVLRDQRLRSWDHGSGLAMDEVSAVRVRPDGTVVLGHEGAVTLLVDGVPRPIAITTAGRGGRVMGIAPAADGGEWLACGRFGLVHLAADGSLERVLGADDGATWVAAATAAGDSLWLATGDGLAVWRDGRLRLAAVDSVSGWATPSLRRILPLPDGTILAGAQRHGVLRLGPDGIRWLSAPGDDGAGSVYALLPRDNGDVWVGTRAGLRRLTDKGIQDMGPADTTVDRPVYALAEDKLGRVWIGTDAGVLIWNGRETAALGPTDGLLGAESNRDALVCDDLGRMWIGTDRGVNVWDERMAPGRQEPTRARIERLEVDGVAAAGGDRLVLASDARRLRFHVRSNSLRTPESQFFQTRLDGFDAEWSAPRPLSEGSLRYTGLPAGHYRFLVRAIGPDGRAGPVAGSVPVVVPVPLLKRPWVIAGNVAALLLLAWIVASGVSARRYAGRLRREVEARTAELHASADALRRESTRLAVVLGSISDAVVVVDAGGAITLDNPAAQALLAVDGRPLSGRPVDEVLPGIGDMVREASASNLTGTGTFIAPGGTFRYLVPSMGRVVDVAVGRLDGEGGRPGSRVLVLRDVTGRRSGA